MERLSKSREDYLEAILMITKSKGSCLSVDIANHLSITKASVCVAVKNLEFDGYITRDGNDIKLTDKGKKIAGSVFEKHLFITEMLVDVGVNKKTAERDACLMEHNISNESYQKLKKWWKANKTQKT